MKPNTNLFIFIIGGLLLLSSSYLQRKENRKYFKPDFNVENISYIESRFIHFEDTIPNDTIHICFADNKFPYAYYREVFTTVCNEHLCLPVWLLIYWSPGGDYLGYTIKNNGFFTKLKHTKFAEEDYLRLQILLDDPQSILRNYKMTDLVSNTQSTSDSIDGISGATILDVANYVIKGAVYTTYTLWHTVYGPSLDSIRNISLEYLTLPFLESLMFSPYREDILFAHDILKRSDFEANESILRKLEEFIASDDYIFSENSIDALLSCGKSDSLIQESLMKAFNESAYGTKLRILRILNNHSQLSPNTIEELLGNLSTQSGEIIKKILSLLQNRIDLNISNKLRIAELLTHENRFISMMAYDYISSLDNKEETLLIKIQEYETKLELN